MTSHTRVIGLLTVGRSDYGIVRPILKQVRQQGLKPYLLVTGAHLSSEFGSSVNDIVSEGFEIAERIEMALSSDTPEGTAKSMGLGTLAFAQSFARFRPDVLLVVGDRFEAHAAVVAAAPFRIPVAHVHGGEVTEGAVDELLRHSITKMSHLHFAATSAYAQRVIQMGEESWRVTVSGAPALDNLTEIRLCSRQDLAERLTLDLTIPPLLVTYHPVTLEYEDTSRQITELLAALAQIDRPIVFTYPNADMGSGQIRDAIRQFGESHSNARIVLSLGTQAYFGLMKYCAAMIGNSSSGIIEAPSFHLPVVNVGSRQNGRERAPNIIDCPCNRGSIGAAIDRALDPEFRESLRGMTNPYGDGKASAKIVDVLRTVPLDGRLTRKQFARLEILREIAGNHL